MTCWTNAIDWKALTAETEYFHAWSACPILCEWILKDNDNNHKNLCYFRYSREWKILLDRRENNHPSKLVWQLLSGVVSVFPRTTKITLLCFHSNTNALCHDAKYIHSMQRKKKSLIYSNITDERSLSSSSTVFTPSNLHNIKSIWNSHFSVPALCTVTDLLHVNEATHNLLGFEHRFFALYD